jgi:hypothetical protein
MPHYFVNGSRKCGGILLCHEEILPAGKWMESMILSEVSQAQKTKNCMFSLICRL